MHPAFATSESIREDTASTSLILVTSGRPGARPHFKDQMSASISRISSFCLSMSFASVTSGDSRLP